MAADTDETVVVRAADPADAPALALLTLHWTVGSEPDDEAVRRLAVGLEHWMRTDGASHLAALALVGDAPAGMAWLALVPRPPREAGQRRRSGDLQSVYVEPDHRGRGVGQRLVEHLLLAAGTRTVVHSSDSAVGFYRHLGFAGSGQLLERPVE